MTTLIVDGYNAINAISETKKLLDKNLRAARSAILAISKEYARTSGYITNVIVVFDGDDKYLDLPRKKSQVFSKTGQGDDKIIETINKTSRKGKVVVASNDNYVRNNGRAYGAKIINVEELKKKKIKEQTGSASGRRLKAKKQREITEEYKKMLGL